eukprot:3882792-Rhodomonas_salina.1
MGPQINAYVHGFGARQAAYAGVCGRRDSQIHANPPQNAVEQRSYRGSCSSELAADAMSVGKRGREGGEGKREGGGEGGREERE